MVQCVSKLTRMFSCIFSKLHGLIACGGEDGALECFDLRMRSSVGRINAVASTGDVGSVSLLLSSYLCRPFQHTDENETWMCGGVLSLVPNTCRSICIIVCSFGDVKYSHVLA